MALLLHVLPCPHCWPALLQYEAEIEAERQRRQQAVDTMADLNATISALRSEIAAQQVGVLVLVECCMTLP